jgi:thiol reductant ABC exporter CydC subunit
MSTHALAGVVGLVAPRRRRLLLAIVLSAGAVLSAVALMATAGYLIVRASEQPPILTLTVAIVGIRAFALSRAVLRYAERLVSHDLALRALGDLRARCYAKLAPLVPAGLPGRRAGDLLARFVGDVDVLQDLYVRVLIPPIVAAIAIAAAAIAAGVVAPAVGVTLGLTLAVAAVAVPVATGLAARGAARRQGPLRSALTSELVDALDGGAELAVLGRTEERLDRLDTLDGRLQRAATRDAVAAGLAGGLAPLLSGAAVLAVIITAVPRVQAGEIDGVLLGFLALLALASAEAVAPLGDAARRFGACAAAATRLDEMTSSSTAVLDPPEPMPIPELGDLVVEGVDMAFAGRVVLEGVDLRVAPGQAVGVVGATGSGKTTLGRLLVRFADPTRGRLAIGGADLRDVAQDDLRRHVLLAEHDARVFATTIRANLRVADPDAGDERLWAALSAVGLDEEVATMPAGLDTDCGTDGDALSGGQRRRLLVARALLSPARVLVLDEPAAHLEPAAAHALL